MHWLLQSGFEYESGWTDLIAALERSAIPYSLHKVVPFVGELVPSPPDSLSKVFCVGSYAMRKMAKARGWQPGVVDLEEVGSFRSLMASPWRKHLLNADSLVSTFGEAKLDGPRFIRPVNDSKFFAGQVVEAQEFRDWQHKVCVLGEDYGDSLSAATEIQIARPKTLEAEYRFWVVDDQVSTASRYKMGGRVVYDRTIDADIEAFISMLCGRRSPDYWRPESAYVMDVARTPDGIRVVELNTINSCGFYAANVPKLVLDLEEYYNVQN